MIRIPRVAWMMVEQGVFSSTNFVLNVLFARWLSPTEYGLFAVSFGGFVFMSCIHWGGILEPLLVLSGRITSSQRRAYVTTIGLAHAILALAAGAIGGLAILITSALGLPVAGWAVLGAGLGGTMLLTLVTGRRLCLIFLSPIISVLLGGLYFVCVAATVLSLPADGHSFLTVWEILGGWSCLLAVIIFGILWRYTSAKQHQPFSLRDLIHSQRRYSPAATVAAIMAWAGFDGVLLLQSAILGLPSVAGTRAVLNIGNPVQQANMVLHTSWLVRFGERHQQRSEVSIFVWLYVGATVACVAVLSLVAEPLVHLTYAGRYDAFAFYLPLYVGGLGMQGLSNMITSQLKATGGLWQGFVPDIIGSIVAVLSAIVLIRQFGQDGALYGVLSGCFVTLALTSLFFRYAHPLQYIQSERSA
jgi:O-antigen/teichoic acid export membrane protein